MKYFGIAIALVISIVLAADILSLDYGRLTEFGQGYLVGRVIMLLLSLAVTGYLAMKIVRERKRARG